MKHHWKVAGVVAFVALFLAPGADAQGWSLGRGWSGMRGYGPGFGPYMAAALKLTTEQEEKIGTLRDEMRAELGMYEILHRHSTEVWCHRPKGRFLG